MGNLKNCHLYQPTNHMLRQTLNTLLKHELRESTKRIQELHAACPAHHGQSLHCRYMRCMHEARKRHQLRRLFEEQNELPLRALQECRANALVCSTQALDSRGTAPTLGVLRHLQRACSDSGCAPAWDCSTVWVFVSPWHGTALSARP